MNEIPHSNPLVVERIYPNDNRVKRQTIEHHMRRYLFAQSARHPVMGDRAIDLACGTGYGTNLLAQAGYRSFGVDLSLEAVSYAHDHFSAPSYWVENLESVAGVLQSHPDEFDCITFFEAIEHLPPALGIAVIESAAVALREGGVFILSTPREINQIQNGFHQSRWDMDTLQFYLTRAFPQVTMLGQDWDTGDISLEDAATNDFYIGIGRK
jgi:2-polyprenyl-3-methyl-5-hydroxy-6-metoxy-1,4-benzoquinol methylase